MSRPFVSVLTPTYNRRRFIPFLIECYKEQTYPHDRMEWIILDDGKEKVGEFFKNLKLPNIRYIELDTKITIGAKRNFLNKEAKGDIIVCMDDDDYYPPERVAHAVHVLTGNPKIQLAGSSEIYMFYTDNKKIYKFGPYGPYHGTNGTFAYKRAYLANHKYDDTKEFAEETSFTNKFSEPLAQLNPHKVMIVLAHSENTFDKKKLRENLNNFVAETGMQLKTFIRNKKLREFYQNA